MIVLGGAVGWSMYRRAEAREAEAALETGSCRFDRRSDPGNADLQHSIAYQVDPPAGGDHPQEVAQPGAYAAERAPADGLVVHALEHGLIGVWYRPGIPQSDDVIAFAERYPDDVVVVPRATLRQPLAATAWHRRLLCTEPELQTVERFVREYRGEGPENVGQ